jgi:hypothetical protein
VPQLACVGFDAANGLGAIDEYSGHRRRSRVSGVMSAGPVPAPTNQPGKAANSPVLAEQPPLEPVGALVCRSGRWRVVRAVFGEKDMQVRVIVTSEPEAIPTRHRGS